MTILKVHNHYQQPGGEDRTAASEIALLRAHGHRVIEYHVHNDALRRMHLAIAALRTVWNHRVYRDLRQLIRDHRVDVVHFNNTFPLISPAGYYAARAEGAAVVQTLHNYRLLCPNGLLYSRGKICQQCLGQTVPWPALRNRCYRDSLPATAAVAAMLATHRLIGTWSHAVDYYIATTEHSRNIFVRGGLPSDRIVVKPHFLDADPGPGAGTGGYAVFAGRLSAEKGLDVLLQAWGLLPDPPLPLKIIGDGPLAALVLHAARQNPHIEWLGRRAPAECCDLIGQAALLILPSRCYETFGRVAIEAFSRGTPVIVSDIGACAELVEDGRSGLHFRTGDPRDLAAKVRQIASDPVRLARMRQAARDAFEARFTARRSYEMLIDIYQQAMYRGTGPCSAAAGRRPATRPVCPPSALSPFTPILPAPPRASSS